MLRYGTLLAVVCASRVGDGRTGAVDPGGRGGEALRGADLEVPRVAVPAHRGGRGRRSRPPLGEPRARGERLEPGQGGKGLVSVPHDPRIRPGIAVPLADWVRRVLPAARRRS